MHDALVGWLIDQRTTTIHMPDADRLSIRDHTAIYEAVAARDPMRAFHEMTSHLRLISELYANRSAFPTRSCGRSPRDVAGRIERERESMWSASSSGADMPRPKAAKPAVSTARAGGKRRKATTSG